jgi:cytochrome c oxidase subunit 2
MSRTGVAVVLALLPGLALLSGAGEPARAAGAARRIEITASRYAFDPARIEVVRGEAVELAVRSADTEHGLAIPGYALKLKVPKGGGTVAATFVAERAGRFPFECSEYCGSGHKRMRGELVVLEPER